MYRTFTVKQDPMNPSLPTIEVQVNGKLYTIKRETEIFACETKAEKEMLEKKGEKVVPMSVYEVLKTGGVI